MPAAEPADPTPPTTPINIEGAAVIPIRARRADRGAPHRGWNPMDSSPTPDPADRPGSQPDEVLALLADDMEKAFNAIGRSLTNNETAAVYARTLALVEHTLRGAAATGIVTEQQRQAIAELIDGMAQAPRFL